MAGLQRVMDSGPLLAVRFLHALHTPSRGCSVGSASGLQHHGSLQFHHTFRATLWVSAQGCGGRARAWPRVGTAWFGTSSSADRGRESSLTRSPPTPPDFPRSITTQGKTTKAPDSTCSRLTKRWALRTPREARRAASSPQAGRASQGGSRGGESCPVCRSPRSKASWALVPLRTGDFLGEAPAVSVV